MCVCVGHGAELDDVRPVVHTDLRGQLSILPIFLYVVCSCVLESDFPDRTTKHCDLSMT